MVGSGDKSSDGVGKDEAKSDGNRIKAKKKEINSWDRSSSNSNESGPGDLKHSDWDLSSDCHETMVEPFDDKLKTYNDWDTDSDEPVFRQADVTQIAAAARCPVGPGVTSPGPVSSEGTPRDLTEIGKITLFDVYNDKESEVGSADVGSEDKADVREDPLLIEDLEEFLARENGEGEKRSSGHRVRSGSSKRSSTGRRSTADSTTVWMIPKSGGESPSTAGNSKHLLTVSERDMVEKVYGEGVADVKKAKSSSAIDRKGDGRGPKSCRSDRLPGSAGVKGLDTYENLLIRCEGPESGRKMDVECKIGKTKGTFDETGVYFAEYECRTATMDRDPGKTPSAPIDLNENREERQDDERDRGPDTDGTESCDQSKGSEAVAGPSPAMQPSLEVVSLPDIIGRKSNQKKEKVGRRLATPGKSNGESVPSPKNQNAVRMAAESWFLLDETGQYQEVTRDEVTILLNGRSADTVLHGHKEHVVQNSTISDTNQAGAQGCTITKESIRNILRQEDVGGEGQHKMVDLERKVENTLLYIQPGVNLTASIRIIPVETEMIHLWRRSRDNGSLLSSEVDLRCQISQDSVENPYLKSDNHNPYVRRCNLECCQQTLSEQDENQAAESHNRNSVGPSNAAVSDSTDQRNVDYSTLLLETRSIVDNLTKNITVLQTRLDGETHRSLALQDEVQKLRQMLNDVGESGNAKVTARESVNETAQSTYVTPTTSFTVGKPPGGVDNANSECNRGGEKMEISVIESTSPAKASGRDSRPTNNDIITVNIYTTDEVTPNCSRSGVTATNSLLQANLQIIDGKMKHLQQENNVIATQNVELKRKLKEISLELEKYLSSTTDTEDCVDDEKDADALRDQVYNLKLELENLKNEAKKQEKILKLDNDVIRDQLEANSITLSEWQAASDRVFRIIENSKHKLRDIGHLEFDTFDFFDGPGRGPATLLWSGLDTFLTRVTDRLLALDKENSDLADRRDRVQGPGADGSGDREANLRHDLNRLVASYRASVDKCRTGGADTGQDHVLDDYFAVIMEKASLAEEMKMLKTENEMLVQAQAEHHEKLKQTMVALKDRKSEIVALQSSQKLSEEERTQMVDMLKLYEEQKESLEKEMEERGRRIEELATEKREISAELAAKIEEIETVRSDMKNLEEVCRVKEDIMKQMNAEKEQFLKVEEIRLSQIDTLTGEVNNLEMQRNQFESEISSMKAYMTQSQKEMTEYISHLESVVNGHQDTLEKNKQKLKDANQALSRLKTDHEALEKQYQCELKVSRKARDELDECTDKLASLTNKYKVSEDEKDRLSDRMQRLTNSEREMSEALDAAARECKLLQSENAGLREKVELYSRDKDETLKEQKDLINKYAMMSKELQKVQDKYRHVKAECNERTHFIGYLEMMLKENMVEYNNKIGYLENNITHILDKIAACKHTMRDKQQAADADAEVRQLRQELTVTHQQRRQLEDMVTNYYSVMKNLESEVQEREKEVDELHRRLSAEQQKTTGETKVQEIEAGGKKNLDVLKMAELENDVLTAESELAECQKKLKMSEANHENEKKKLELTISDLKTEISRYQLRIEVMMKNFPKGKTSNSSATDKKSAEEMTKKIESLTEDLEARERRISDLTEALDKCERELRIKDTDLENSAKRNVHLREVTGNFENQVRKLESALLAANKANEKQLREKNEIAEKLLQSIKIIMEEKSARQTTELLTAEKEKHFKEQLDQVKIELEGKSKNCSTLTDAVDEKKKCILKLQHDLKKMKVEVVSLRGQISSMSKTNSPYLDSGTGLAPRFDDPLSESQSLKLQNFSPERFESCLRELKEVRDMNLVFRKAEGEYQAKIVRLEDELRDARLLVKELQGNIKIEKKSKKAFKNMIISAKIEIDKFLGSQQIIPTVADRISRHLDLRGIPSRSFQLPDRSNSSDSIT